MTDQLDGAILANSSGPAMSRRAVMSSLSAAALGLTASRLAAQTGREHAVVELRQYKIVRGARDRMIALFERELLEGQEALGMRLIGQFRDLDDPDRFTWIRAFRNMAARQAALDAFYSGPIWLAHRGEANPLLVDNDNVLLLRPAGAQSGFRPMPRPANGEGGAGLVVATIHYLWKDPAEGFSDFFDTRLRPALVQAGLSPLAAFVPEAEPNSFPRLPVRQGERVFVWFARASDQADYDRRRAMLHAAPGWPALAAMLHDFEEREAQVLRLAPTPRSRLR